MWSEVYDVEEERAGLGRECLWTDAGLTHGGGRKDWHEELETGSAAIISWPYQ